MLNVFSVLLSSRKFWIGTFSLLAVAVATALRVYDKIPADALLPTIAGITGLGFGVINGIATEDAARHTAGTHTGKPDPSLNSAPKNTGGSIPVEVNDESDDSNEDRKTPTEGQKI